MYPWYQMMWMHLHVVLCTVFNVSVFICYLCILVLLPGNMISVITVNLQSQSNIRIAYHLELFMFVWYSFSIKAFKISAKNHCTENKNRENKPRKKTGAILYWPSEINKTLFKQIFALYCIGRQKLTRCYLNRSLHVVHCWTKPLEIKHQR